MVENFLAPKTESCRKNSITHVSVQLERESLLLTTH